MVSSKQLALIGVGVGVLGLLKSTTVSGTGGISGLVAEVIPPSQMPTPSIPTSEEAKVMVKQIQAQHQEATRSLWEYKIEIENQAKAYSLSGYPWPESFQTAYMDVKAKLDEVGQPFSERILYWRQYV